MCFVNDSPWNGQGIGEHCLSGIDRMIYQHSVYSNNVFISLSQGCDFWYQVSHCTLLATFRGNGNDFSDVFLPKDARIIMTTSLWNSNILLFCFCIVWKKVPCICHWSVYRPFKERPPPFLWLNTNSICAHKLIEQINTNHLLVAVLKRFWHWYMNPFLGWLWPPLSCADWITGNIVGSTSHSFVIQPRHYQIFTIGRKIIGSSGFLC